MSLEHVEKLIKDHKVEFVDLRFCRHARRAAPRDLPEVDRRRRRCSRTARCSTARRSPAGRASTSPTWSCCRMRRPPFLDPFTADPTLVLTCDILDPATMQAYSRDPRGVAKRAEAFLKSSGIADTGVLRSGARVLHLRLRPLRERHGPHLLPHRLGRSALELGPRIRRRQHRLPPGHQGRLLPGRAAGLAARPARRDVQDARSRRHRGRSAPPRSRERRPVRDRHQVQHAGEEGRRTADDEVRHQERRAPQRQDRDLHAQADRRRQRQRHARAPVAGQGRQQPVLRRRLRRPVADGAVVHRRHLQARARDQRVRQLDHQLVQAPGAGLRGAGDAGVLGEQPFGVAAASRTWRTRRRAASRSASPIR